MTILLRSVAGSHLYGLSRPDSDLDYYEVHSSLESTSHTYKTQQTIVDGIDTTMVSFSHFIELAAHGSHQALDAMFSHRTEIDEISAMREGYHVGFAVVEPYIRIISKFSLQGTPRKRKHAVRAAYNLRDMLETGRFDPTLTSDRAEKVLAASVLPSEEFERVVRGISPVELPERLTA